MIKPQAKKILFKGIVIDNKNGFNYKQLIIFKVKSQLKIFVQISQGML